MATELRPKLSGVEIGALEAAHMGEAAAVLARGMRDNPILVAALGRDPARRQETLTGLFKDVATAMPWTRQTLVARCADGSVVGVCRVVPPDECRPTPRQLARLLPSLVRIGPRMTGRLLGWQSEGSKRHARERHWQLGPLAVDAHLQGRGIGTRLMQVVCARLDAAGDDAFLETDKAINVAFFARFDFAVVGQAEVCGVTIWSMRRRAMR